MRLMRSGKQQKTEGIELPNQEKLRALGEEETYQNLRILEADNIKQAVMKEKKLKMSISGERENYSKPCYVAKTLSNG